jgi:hypothetical protein
MSLKKSAEISWFAPICDGDDDFLGNRNPLYKSSWENTCKIVQTADKLGYKNVVKFTLQCLLELLPQLIIWLKED